MTDKIIADSSLHRGWLTGGLALALVLSLAGNFVQRQSLGRHTVPICDDSTHRVRHKKRSVMPALEYEVGTPPPPLAAAEHGDSPYFLPLYTRITESQLTKMCQAKYRKNYVVNSSPKRIPHNDQSHKDDAQNLNDRYRYQVISQPSVRPLKVCQPIQSLGTTSCVGERVHRQGAALRKGDRWLLTEFAMGNILFQFDLHAAEAEPDPEEEAAPAYEFQRLADRRRSTVTPTDLPLPQLRFPSRIHTLTESFHGTDHTVDVSGDDLVFYYVGAGLVRLQAVHLRNGRRVSRLIDAANEPLYKQTNKQSSDNLSAVDLEADGGVLWALFRAANDTALTVAKLAPNSLKELARYRLTLVQPHQIANAFIACGILHTVNIIDYGAATVLSYHNNGDVYANNKSADRSNRNHPTVVNENGRRHGRGHGRRRDDSSRKFIVQPIFDFHAERYMKASRLLYVDWPYDSDVSSVQYDNVSDSITLFSNGKIVLIPLQREAKPL